MTFPICMLIDTDILYFKNISFVLLKLPMIDKLLPWSPLCLCIWTCEVWQCQVYMTIVSAYIWIHLTYQLFFSTCRDACPLVPLCVYNGMMSCMFAGARFGSPLLASRRPCRCRREETYDPGGGGRVSASVAFFELNHCIHLTFARLFVRVNRRIKNTTRIVCSCEHVSFIICIGDISLHMLKHIHIAHRYLFFFFCFLQNRVSSMRLQPFPSCNVIAGLALWVFDCVDVRCGHVHCWRWRKSDRAQVSRSCQSQLCIKVF